MRYRKYAFITVFVCVFSLSCTQEETREPKQHPDLGKLVRNWAQKLGGELWHFGEMVTRKNKVKDSFKSTTVVVEDGEAMLKDIHEKVSQMMNSKVEAVRRIMDVAEQAAKDQKEDIDFNFQFYNAKNLTNSAPNASDSDEEQSQPNDGPEAQESRYEDAFVTRNNKAKSRSEAMVQPEENESFLQKDQDQEENVMEESSSKSDEDYIDADGEVTNEPEKLPQASVIQPKDKYSLPLYRNRHFYNIPVNTNYSTVHVPSNVYERSKEVLSGIIWSEVLDKTFRDNYKSDPTLSWQYFGSSTGFMRQFPALIWKQEPIDLYDCRMRPWFIEGAASPKDVIILVDRSGSMTGMRREVARHVVHNILDTLSNNDYINIFTFTNTTDPLVECFDQRLVQANLANIRILKEAMSEFKTEQIANFTSALTTAFELLQQYREEKQGANCNQVIMLVTDGSQYNYKEVFEKYNWNNSPFINVRVFTYLIGKEVSDTKEVKWMACANQGYYVHLSTYAEVREEVLHYLPVLARPMVLNGSQKPNPAWSPVYADVADPKLTNWLWVMRERNRQRERFLAFRHNMSLEEVDRKFVKRQTHGPNNGETQAYHLMTSVSLPVYDKKPRQERVANLLGVAGTDVPVEYIQKLMLCYKLGVNGYGFIVTNNGYILIHPDLRPVYQGILKPAYNRVDMSEIEIMDDENEPRDFSDEILELRNQVIFQKKGNVTLKVKTHLDDMKRIVVSKRHYYYTGINGTPFGLVIALPHKYGFNKIQHAVENDIHRIRTKYKVFRQFFTGNWTIHPEWHYCRYLDDRHFFDTPEEEFFHFLKLIEEPGWKWTSECDRKLVTNVVADAKITDWFSQNITTTTKEEIGAQLIRHYGIVVAFMATHSGLTRWQEFPQNLLPNVNEPRLFHILHNRAIDEVWYRRAVEHYFVDSSNFIYSVPHDAGNENYTLVTVSHAIFKEEGSRKAPAAVVGYQFYHSALYSLFAKITTSCAGVSTNCTRTCASGELHCLLLDDNGYIIVSDEQPGDTGRFFGRMRPDIMALLVEEGIYRVHRMFDYQGLCPEPRETASPASRLQLPLYYLLQFFEWVLATMVFLLQTVAGNDLDPYLDTGHHLADPAIPIPPPSREKEEFNSSLLIQKTKPEPCDLEMYLYTLVHYTERNVSNSGYNKTMSDDCKRPFIVQRVTGSNMILLVINQPCPENSDVRIPLPDPVKVDYNMSLHCYRTSHELPRRLYMSCINKSANESEIKICGKGTNISTTNIVLLLLALYLLRFV